jgi:hypothetical protein
MTKSPQDQAIPLLGFSATGRAGRSIHLRSRGDAEYTWRLCGRLLVIGGPAISRDPQATSIALVVARACMATVRECTNTPEVSE